ncbi:MAG: hypothetical protein C0446_08485 [Chitinophaga sp.]|nr:hypothetical protein [Chitinophaga sp.]
MIDDEEQISNIKRIDFKGRARPIKQGQQAEVISFETKKQERFLKSIKAKVIILKDNIETTILHEIMTNVTDVENPTNDETVILFNRIRALYRNLYVSDVVTKEAIDQLAEEFIEGEALFLSVTLDDFRYADLLNELKGPDPEDLRKMEVYFYTGDGRTFDFTESLPSIFNSEEEFLDFLNDDGNLNENQKEIHKALSSDYKNKEE